MIDDVGHSSNVVDLENPCFPERQNVNVPSFRLFLKCGGSRLFISTKAEFRESSNAARENTDLRRSFKRKQYHKLLKIKHLRLMD
jgi:hypothetical protein